MNDGITVRSSGINGTGVFASRDFAAGETVMEWNPRPLESGQAETLGPDERKYLYTAPDGRQFVMQPPERFVNHACDPNTRAEGLRDIAVRPIAAGEEITSDYGVEPNIVRFECRCGSPKCRGHVGG